MFRANFLGEQFAMGCREKPRGTFTVVQSLYSEPGVTVSVERKTTWPENGSYCDI